MGFGGAELQQSPHPAAGEGVAGETLPTGTPREGEQPGTAGDQVSQTFMRVLQSLARQFYARGSISRGCVKMRPFKKDKQGKERIANLPCPGEGRRSQAEVAGGRLEPPWQLRGPGSTTLGRTPLRTGRSPQLTPLPQTGPVETAVPEEHRLGRGRSPTGAERNASSRTSPAGVNFLSSQH